MQHVSETDLAPGKRMATLTEAMIPLVAVAVFLGVGYGILDIRVEILLIAATLVAGFIGWRMGYTYEEMQDGINVAFYKSMTALLIVTVVGALIASWIACGTIPMLIFYGLKIISPAYFLVTASIVCSVVSVITGTSWGTVGTVGIALMGVGEGLGIDRGMAAGAIVAGAYFGDKLSLFSDTTNLAPIAARSNIYDHVAHTLWTTTPAFVISLIVYLIVGKSSGTAVQSEDVAMLSTGLTDHFNIQGIFIVLLLAVPPAITLGAAVFKMPVLPSMVLSCAIAWVLAFTLQGSAPVGRPYIEEARVAELAGGSVMGYLGEGEIAAARDKLQVESWDLIYPLYAMVQGYKIETGISSVDGLLSRGGMMSMMDTLLVAFAAFCLAGVMSVTRMLETLLNSLLKVAKTTGTLVLSTAVSCIVVAVCTGSSYLSILLPGELFSKAFRDRGLAAKNLSRTTEDCGTVLVPLVPWSAAGIYMAGILEVPVMTYAPWAIMCYLGAFFAILYGFTGFKIAPRIRDDETIAGS